MIRPNIVPEKNSGTIPNCAACNSTKKVAQPKDVFPPKRTDFPGSMQYFALIVFPPDELDPRNLSFVIKFV